MWIVALGNLVAGFSVVALIAAQQTPPPRPTGVLAPGGTGIIAGQVFDPTSRKAVPGAIVWLGVGAIMGPDSPRVLADAEGRFVFANVPAGSYLLRSQKHGHSDGWSGQKRPTQNGRNFDLVEGQILTDVALPIWKFAAMGGVVTDEFGEPVVGVTVQAMQKVVAFGEVGFSPPLRGSTTTDDRGAYRLSSLVPGEYAVGVVSTLTTLPAEIMPDLLGPKGMPGEVTSAIRELGPLGDPKNQQVGTSVLMTTTQTPIPPAPTGDEVAAVYPTTFWPSAAGPGDAGTVTLRLGEERSGIDVSLRPARAVPLSGRLIGPNGPLAHTAVRLAAAEASQAGLGKGFEVATGVSDASGQFTLLGVPEGRYVLTVESPRSTGQPVRSSPLLWASEVVTVPRTSPQDIVVNVHRAPRVTGHIELRETRTMRPGSFEITIFSIGFGGIASTFPDPGQPFAFELPPGRYQFRPFGPPEMPCTAAIAQGRDVSDELLTIGTDDIEVKVLCGDRPTSLSGTVRGDAGQPDPEGFVVVFPTEPRFWSGGDVRPRRFSDVAPESSGAFRIANLPAGEYFVAAIPAEDSYAWQDPTKLATIARTATRVSFSPGEARTVELKTSKIK